MARWVTFNAEDGAELTALVDGEHPDEHLDLHVFSFEAHDGGIERGVTSIRNVGRGHGPVSWKPKERKRV